MTDATLQVLRRFLLAILLIGMSGTAVELLLLEHDEERFSSCRWCCSAPGWRVGRVACVFRAPASQRADVRS